MSSITDREQRIESLDPDGRANLRRELLESAMTVMEAARPAAEWYHGTDPISVTLPAGDWFRLTTAAFAFAGTFASMVGADKAATDCAFVVGDVSSQLAAAISPPAAATG